MKAIIMAGGEGRRLKAVTGDLPKPMVPLLGKPLMERIIELLRENGVTDICATLKYAPEVIKNHFGNGSRLGVRLTYRVEEEALGTAGGVKNCEDFYGGEDFLVISGDAACDFDLTALMAEHHANKSPVTMALYPSSEPTGYGLVLIDTGGRVRHFIEKPDWRRVVTNLANTGIYIVSPRAMDLVPKGKMCDFAKDLFPKLMERGEEIRGVPMQGYWCDVGTPRSYYRCSLDALDGTLRLPEGEIQSVVPSAPPAPSPEPLIGEYRAALRLPCRDRAAMMRHISENMLELGADFSNGVTLSGKRCGVRVAPLMRDRALRIEAASDDESFSEQLAMAMEKLARELS